MNAIPKVLVGTEFDPSSDELKIEAIVRLVDDAMTLAMRTHLRHPKARTLLNDIATCLCGVGTDLDGLKETASQPTEDEMERHYCAERAFERSELGRIRE